MSEGDNRSAKERFENTVKAPSPYGYSNDAGRAAIDRHEAREKDAARAEVPERRPAPPSRRATVAGEPGVGSRSRQAGRETRQRAQRREARETPQRRIAK